MPETPTTTAQPLSAAVSPSAASPLPGTRAALMRAASDALRAAAVDVVDPRTTPLPGAQGRRPDTVAAWLTKRAELLTPPPLSSWERNQLVRVDLVEPGLPPELRRAVVEALQTIAYQLGGYGLTVHQLPHLVSDLVAAFQQLHADRAAS